MADVKVTIHTESGGSVDEVNKVADAVKRLTEADSRKAKSAKDSADIFTAAFDKEKKEVEDWGKKWRQAKESTDEATVSHNRLLTALKPLGSQLFGLGIAVRAFLNPFTLLAAALGASIAVVERFVSRANEAARMIEQMNSLTKGTALFLTTVAQNQNKADEFAESLRQISENAGSAATKLEKVQGLIARQAEVEHDVAKAQEEKALKAIDAAEAGGKITPQEAIRQRAAITTRFVDAARAREETQERQKLAALRLAKTTAEKTAADLPSARAALEDAQLQQQQDAAFTDVRLQDIQQEREDLKKIAGGLSMGQALGRVLKGQSGAEAATDVMNARARLRELAGQEQFIQARGVRAAGRVTAAQGRVTRAEQAGLQVETLGQQIEGATEAGTFRFGAGFGGAGAGLRNVPGVGLLGPFIAPVLGSETTVASGAASARNALAAVERVKADAQAIAQAERTAREAERHLQTLMGHWGQSQRERDDAILQEIRNLTEQNRRTVQQLRHNHGSNIQ